MAFKYRSIFYVICMALVMAATACGQSTGKVTTPAQPSATENKTAAKPPIVKAEPKQPAKLASQQKIVFWSLRDAIWSWSWGTKKNILADTNYEIFIMDPDGKNPINLTKDPARDLIPRLSPDGKKILFVSDRKWEPENKLNDGSNIFVMDTDGSNINNLTGSEKWSSMPCWSPDGKMIVFCSTHASYTDIWIMDAGGNNFLKMTIERNSAVNFMPSWPSWSPDGKKILYTSAETGTYDISAIEINYNLVKQLVLNPAPENYTGEKWSGSENRRIVRHISSSLGVNELVSGTKKLTLNPTGFDGGAYWSPDGTKIAYVSSRKDSGAQIYDIYVMDADGSNPTNLTNSINVPDKGAYNDWPAWSPDGKKISFVSDRDGQPLDFGTPYKYACQIYEMNADGSNITRITNNNYADGSPNWGNVPYDIAENLQVPVSLVSLPTTETTIIAIDLAMLKKNIGKAVAVEGQIVDFGSNGDDIDKPIFLYFDNANQHCQSYDEWKKGSCGTDFRIVIFRNDLNKFPDIYSYKGKKVQIVGQLDNYKGAPSIIAYNPEQITAIK